MRETAEAPCNACTQPLRLGFIGGGINSAVGRAHFNAVSLDGLYRLTAGCFSRNLEINHASAQTYAVAAERVYPSWQAMLDAEAGKLDAIAVLTPTSAHLTPLLACLERGFPVICEKAMTATVGDAEIVRASQIRHQGFVAVTFNYTGYPALRELRALIRGGKLGELRHFIAEMPQEGYLRRNPDGSPVRPQSWRLQDGPIPTVYLDLGVHLHQIVHYLTGLHPIAVAAFHDSRGNFPEVVDYVTASAEYENGVHGTYYFGKSMLGYRNGLKIRIFGSRASAEWEQTRPEEIRLAHADGTIEILDRGGNTEIAGLPRYARFKAGHPSGYIEAFANLYADIRACLVEFQRTGVFASDEVFGTQLARDGLVFLQAMAESARQRNRLPVIEAPANADPAR